MIFTSLRTVGPKSADRRSIIRKKLIILWNLVRVEGLEPPRLAAPEPKSGASTNFATPAVDWSAIFRFFSKRKSKLREQNWSFYLFHTLRMDVDQVTYFQKWLIFHQFAYFLIFSVVDCLKVSMFSKWKWAIYWKQMYPSYAIVLGTCDEKNRSYNKAV